MSTDGRPPRIHTLLTIADALGVLVTDLLPPLLTASAPVTWDAVVAAGVDELAAARLVLRLRALDQVGSPDGSEDPTSSS